MFLYYSSFIFTILLFHCLLLFLLLLSMYTLHSVTSYGSILHILLPIPSTTLIILTSLHSSLYIFCPPTMHSSCAFTNYVLISSFLLPHDFLVLQISVTTTRHFILGSWRACGGCSRSCTRKVWCTAALKWCPSPLHALPRSPTSRLDRTTRTPRIPLVGTYFWLERDYKTRERC